MAGKLTKAEPYARISELEAENARLREGLEHLAKGRKPCDRCGRDVIALAAKESAQ